MLVDETHRIFKGSGHGKTAGNGAQLGSSATNHHRHQHICRTCLPLTLINVRIAAAWSSLTIIPSDTREAQYD